jgi:uncharacterized membrane-anchored protein YitT (DUF2179 family)
MMAWQGVILLYAFSIDLKTASKEIGFRMLNGQTSISLTSYKYHWKYISYCLRMVANLGYPVVNWVVIFKNIPLYVTSFVNVGFTSFLKFPRPSSVCCNSWLTRSSSLQRIILPWWSLVTSVLSRSDDWWQSSNLFNRLVHYWLQPFSLASTIPCDWSTTTTVEEAVISG